MYLATTPDFAEHPQVANGASELLVDVLGEAGRHARAAVGMASLPLGASVEVAVTAEPRLDGRSAREPQVAVAARDAGPVEVFEQGQRELAARARAPRGTRSP